MFLVHLVPSRIRVIGGHRSSNLYCVGTEIFFVDDARFVDNESHHARGTVLRRICDEGESCGHLSVDDIVLGSARCIRPLAREYSEKIPIERNMRANLVLWEILARVSDERVNRTIELIARFLPIQTVVFSLIADKFLCVLLGEAVRGPEVVLFLGIHQISAGLNRGQLILANAAE